MHGREKLQTTQVRLLFLFSFFCARCVKKKYTVIVLSNALYEAPHALFDKIVWKYGSVPLKNKTSRDMS